MWQDGEPWYAAMGALFVSWWLLCLIAWRVRRRYARDRDAAAIAKVSAAHKGAAMVVDPRLDRFAAVDAAGEHLLSGRADGAVEARWRIADIASAEVRIEDGWGLLLDRERTPPGRLASTLYFPFQPLMFVFALLTIFDSPPVTDPNEVIIAHRRVRRVSVVATGHGGATFAVTVYDEAYSATYPGAGKARIAAAREVVAAIRRHVRVRREAGEGQAH